MDVDGVELPSPLLAEAQLIACVISAVCFSTAQGTAPITLTCPPVKQRPMKGCLRLRNQATLHVLYAAQCDL